jgi:hypothetical protein
VRSLKHHPFVIGISSGIFATFLASCGGEGPSGNSKNPVPTAQSKEINPSFQLTSSIPPERCDAINSDQKLNPLTPGMPFDFYTLGEDTSRFSINDHETVTVVGDIHGSWEMIAAAVINTGIMEIATPPTKRVSVTCTGNTLSVEIPSLQFKDGGSASRVIFVGDYITKGSRERDIGTLALLNDILMLQKKEKRDSVVAIIGNHDLEAVNGVTHGGYLEEKDFKDQIMQMIQENLLVSTHYDHGIWYSHSYLTETDVKELGDRKIQFTGLDLSSLIGQVNHLVWDLILSGRIGETWLANSSFGGAGNASTFFYSVVGKPADRPVEDPETHERTKFPIIMGHLSDPARMTLRVLTENRGGVHSPEFANRSHILCVDTTLYHSFAHGTDATYLKIDYDSSPSGTAVQWNRCQISTGFGVVK